MAERYWIETLGCPKNQVDSDKLAGTLARAGLAAADAPGSADLVVVNTCAFVEAARQESVDAILDLAAERRVGSRLVVTGCMAERYHDELRDALPEVDLVAPFGVPLTAPEVPRTPQEPPTRTPVTMLGTRGNQDGGRPAPEFDLLNLPRPAASAPWSYVKVAEGCDRSCGFCAIPSFRGKQRSRTVESIVEEVEELDARPDGLGEVVLVAQDLASFGLDRSGAQRAGRAAPAPGSLADGAASDLDAPRANRPIVDLVGEISRRVPWTRLLYLYPSALDESLVEAVLGTGVPYFDLSLQHVSRPLLRRMRRWGDGDRFLDRIRAIRDADPDAAFRSSFILGYPGETEDDHDLLLDWIAEAELDWVGFFPFSPEAGTFAAAHGDQVPAPLVAERIRECSELQDAITARKREALVGRVVEVLVEAPGRGRTTREAPEIDGIVEIPGMLAVGSFVDVLVTGASGPDLVAGPVPDRSAVGATSPTVPRSAPFGVAVGSGAER